MAEHSDAEQHTLVRSAMQELVERTRAVTQQLASVGTGTRGALPKLVRTAVSPLLAAQQRLVESVPPIPDLDAQVQQLRAKRLTLQALQAELAAFDQQLEVLEQAIAPVARWAHEWANLRKSLTDLLDSSDDKPATTD